MVITEQVKINPDQINISMDEIAGMLEDNNLDLQLRSRLQRLLKTKIIKEIVLDIPEEYKIRYHLFWFDDMIDKYLNDNKIPLINFALYQEELDDLKSNIIETCKISHENKL